jgi:hypothetical protein
MNMSENLIPLQQSKPIRKPTVRVCSWCQRINSPELSGNVDQQIKDEMKVVDSQIKANHDNFHFTHGICLLHLTQMYKDMPEKLGPVLRKAELEKGGPVPCLLTDTNLRHAYMRGLFTPRLMKQALKNQQQAKTELTERLKKLAGIHS